MIRRFGHIIIIIVILCYSVSYSYAQHQDSDSSGYLTSKIVVKFKDGKGLSVASELKRQKQTFKSITQDDSLDELLEKYPVKDISRVFKDRNEGGNTRAKAFEFSPQTTKQLEKEQDKRYRDRIERIKKKFPKRTRRAPKNAKIPNLLNIFEIEFEVGVDIEAVCDEFMQNSYIEYACPIGLNELHFDPNDPYYSSSGSWGQAFDDMYALKADKLDCGRAWDFSQGEGVVVAVIDTGVDYNHEDLAGNIWVNEDEIPDNGIDDDENGFPDDYRGWNFADNNPEVIDTDGHGTHCAGIVAAVGNNGVGITGVAPKAKIMSIKAVEPAARDTTLANAIKYAADSGAYVLSNSWGPTGYSASNPILESAVDYAHALGCVVVFSAGNYADDVANRSPANYDKTIAVASVDHEDVKAHNSNFGKLIDVSAPGVEILSLRAAGTDMYLDKDDYAPGERFVPAFDENAKYYRSSGTSMACPHVAGLAALIIAEHPEWSNWEVTGQIVYTSDNINTPNFPVYDGLVGKGRINAYRALNWNSVPYVLYHDYEIVDDPNSEHNDGRFSPGETVELVITVRNRWGPLNDAVVKIYSLDPLVTVLKDQGFVGNIDSGQYADNRDDPFIIKISEQAEYGQDVRLIQKATGSHISNNVYIDVEIPFQKGWPIELKSEFANMMTFENVVADVDHDGKDEVLFGFDEYLYIVNGDGTNCPGWPQKMESTWQNPFYMAGLILVDDLDGDGKYEVITAANNIAGTQQCKIYIWHFEDAVPMEGYWPRYSQKQAVDIITANMDDNLKTREIVLLTNQDSEVRVYRHDGFVIKSWRLNSNDVSKGGITANDFDKDGRDELILSTERPTQSGLYIYDDNGILYNGWFKKAVLFSPPVLVNLDSDKDLEILCGTMRENPDYIYAWNIDGSSVSGWPVLDKATYISIGDVDGDKIPEVLASYCARFSHISLYDIKGQLRWRRQYDLTNPVSICDIDEDGKSEIIFRNDDPDQIWAIDENGDLERGFPISLERYCHGQPAIGDLDGDGDIEIVKTNRRSPTRGPLVYAFDLRNKIPKNIEWPMLYRDAQRSKVYNPPVQGDITGEGNVDIHDLLILSTNWLSDAPVLAQRVFKLEKSEVFGQNLLA